MPAQQGFWLNEEESLLSYPNSSSEEHKEDAIPLSTRWPFHLPLEDEELLA
jgi:hypothetical protein